ncbi:MAG: hypothetical protein DMG59_12645 [Acidobacteria bacterium]|nr:MAG: hypothetical protein DMG59_12645 [Acidobacteriota bacterium]
MSSSLPEGLCDSCAWRRVIRSDRGSMFYLCERSLTDASYPKYPRLPVLTCRGYQRRTEPEPVGRRTRDQS